MKSKQIRTLTGLALMTAVVVILQFLGSFIHLGPFSVSLVLIPIVVGAALYGAGAGGWLGLTFGAVVLISGDASLFMAVNPLAAIVVVLLKGICAGLGAGAVYRLLEKKNALAALMAAAFACPFINTGIFLASCPLFFWEAVRTLADMMGQGDDLVKFLFFGLAGGNFLFELLLNIVLAPAIVRIIRIGKKK